MTLTRFHPAYAARVPLGDTVLITASVSDPDGDTIPATDRQWYRETPTGLVPIGVGDTLRLAADSELDYGVTFVATDPAGTRTTTRTSVSAYDPVTPFLWRVRTGAGIRASIAEGAGGDIIARDSTGIAAFAWASGAWSWHFTTSLVRGPIAVGGAGDIYVAQAQTGSCCYFMTALSANGLLQWQLPNDSANGQPMQSPVILPDGNLVYPMLVGIEHFLRVVSPNGVGLARVFADTLAVVGTGAAIGVDSTVYIPHQRRQREGVAAVAPSGSLRWRLDFGGTQSNGVAPGPVVIADDSTIVFATLSFPSAPADSIFAIRANGSVRWRIAGGGAMVLNTVVVGNGVIFVGYSTGVRALDAVTGSQLWSTPFPAPTLQDPWLTLSADGRVYAVSGPWVRGYDVTTGAEVWRHQFASSVLTAPLLTASGFLVVNDGAGVLEAIDVGSGPLDSPWPQAYADSHRTGRVRIP